MAADGLKVISYAFKEIETGELDRLFQSYSDESDEFRWELEQDLIYLCTFGLEDPCRVGLKGHVQKLRYGKEYGDVNDVPSSDSRNNQVNVRLMTGDHVETARKAGLEAGIITVSESMEDGCVMHAQELRDHLEGYTKTWDPVKSQFQIVFHNFTKFDELKKRLKIIARATSEEKLIMVEGIKRRSGMIGMTGDSIADAEALK